MVSNGREFELIEGYFRDGYPIAKQVAINNGDDASVIEQSLVANGDWVQSIDTQVADVHFPSNAPADRIASRALRCAVSDLAAMGATPHSFHLAITLPDAQPTWLEQFARGLKKTAREFNIALIGGDTTRGKELVITVAVQGSVPSNQALSRAGAQEGDDVWISGVIGAAACGLENILEEPDIKSVESDCYYFPSIYIRLGKSLLGVATACIDISDGLIQDAEHICQQSQLSMILEGEFIPTYRPFEDPQWQTCLTGGDDYCLLFTAPPDLRDSIELHTGVRRIGHMETGQPRVILLHHHQPVALDSIQGFQHF